MTNLALKKREIQNTPHTYYTLFGAIINPSMLAVVFDYQEKESVENERLRRVSDYNITRAGIGKEGCKCHVIPGMTVDALMRLGGGCKSENGELYASTPKERRIDMLNTSGYTCPRLSALRRIYGH